MPTLSNATGDGNAADEVKRLRPALFISVPVSGEDAFRLHGDPVFPRKFSQNLMRNDLREWCGAYILAQYGRDCRTADGGLDFLQEHDDGTWDNESLILDAMILVLIEVCQGHGGLEGATKFLRDKFALLHQCMNARDYELADVSFSDDSVVDEYLP